ncbi:hypothetical protein [Methylomonas fluvii]|nr:hypothetical protein [Methylomonas fluvii]
MRLLVKSKLDQSLIIVALTVKNMKSNLQRTFFGPLLI